MFEIKKIRQSIHGILIIVWELAYNQMKLNINNKQISNQFLHSDIVIYKSSKSSSTILFIGILEQEYHYSIQCLTINHGHVAMDDKR